MGRQGGSSRIKKVGRGKVTAVQVAFIVDRYLAQNGYNKSLAEFRCEAASLLGTAAPHPRQAPKSMLSLVDILDDYIILKEQKIAVSQEKGRIDQLLLGMQDIMYAYHSGGMLPAPAASSSPLLPSPPHISVPYSITSASAAINASVETPTLPLPDSKRKNSSSLPDESVNAKKSCVPGRPVNSFSSERNAQGLQMVASAVCWPSQTGQPSYHTSACPQVFSGNGRSSRLSNSVLVRDSASMVKGSHNQQSPASAQGQQQPLHTTSQTTNDSTCPQTPPQAFCIQPDTSASPLEASNIINSNTAFVGASCTSNQLSSLGEQERIYNGQEADQEVQIVETRSSENLNSSGTYAAPKSLSKDENSGKVPSPGSLNAKKMVKRGHIKSRLDFTSSHGTSMRSPVKSSATGTSTDCASTCHASVTSVEMDDGQFDLADIPIIDPDLDKFMSDFFIDFGLDSDELASVSSLVDQADEMSESLEENRSYGNAIGTYVSSDSHHSRGIGVLTEKDMNIHATVKASNIADSSIAKNTCCRGSKIRGVVDRENVPIV